MYGNSVWATDEKPHPYWNLGTIEEHHTLDLFADRVRNVVVFVLKEQEP